VRTAGREDQLRNLNIVATPTPLAWRKAASGSDRDGEVVLESPESLARGMFPQGLSRNRRELLISSHTKRNASYIGRYATPRVDRRDGGEMMSSLTTPIVPVKLGNRRASAWSGHGTHWREGGNKPFSTT